MIVVTGAAGFIGSCIVARLNELGRKDLYLVDHLDDNLTWEKSKDPKVENIRNKKFFNYQDKADFLKDVLASRLPASIECLIHMGACSSTTLQDKKYFEENNFLYTQHLANWALKNNVRFIYASSAATYGDGSVGYKDDDATVKKCKPLNLYGESKQKFDLWALDKKLLNKMVGLKFFNVFGPNEYHKGDMRSVIAKAYQKVATEGKMVLFKSYHEEYKDGEQKRDFVYVKDAVDMVLFFLERRDVNGIFNVGTGQARSWNDLAKALFKAVGKPLNIEYIEMPEILRPRYQYFTQADMSKLRAAGYKKPFTTLEEAVRDYVQYLKSGQYL